MIGQFDLTKKGYRGKWIVAADNRNPYAPFVNGKKYQDQFLTPGWTEYGTRIQYQEYDVKGILTDKSWQCDNRPL